ncbi:MAG: hypothetical protein KGL35_26105 [Bradyrhizobium sp.]|nr:hypothetical protein [Bradyrhizobium sp.]
MASTISHPTMTNAMMAPTVTRGFSFKVHSRIGCPRLAPVRQSNARQQPMAFLPGRNRAETDCISRDQIVARKTAWRLVFSAATITSQHHVITAIPVRSLRTSR